MVNSYYSKSSDFLVLKIGGVNRGQIAHETMHAVAALFTVLADKPEVGEPYFEDQAVAEVGFGFESAVSLLTSFWSYWIDLHY